MQTEVMELTGGVDTHSEVHVAAVVNNIGKVLGTASFPVTTAVYRDYSYGYVTSGYSIGLVLKALVLMVPACAVRVKSYRGILRKNDKAPVKPRREPGSKQRSLANRDGSPYLRS